MKVAVVCNAYPSETEYGGAFVHARLKAYRQMNVETRAFVKDGKAGRRVFEGIEVLQGGIGDLVPAIRDFDPDIVAVHAPSRNFGIPLALSVQRPTVAWIHGMEALLPIPQKYYWYVVSPRDLSEFPYWLQRSARSIIQLIVLRRFLRRCAGVVYVSNWMRWIATRMLAWRELKGTVLYNPVDTSMFKGGPKAPGRQGVSIRSFTNRKYGLDIAIKAYAGDNTHSLTLVGKGPLEGELAALVRRYRSSVSLQVGNTPHNLMPHLLARYDYYVMPSRMEAQGVSMCEAMAAGLPPVASRVGGIPEIVRNGIDGILYSPNEPVCLRKARDDLLESPKLFRLMSENAADRVRSLCDSKKICELELDLMERILSSE